MINKAKEKFKDNQNIKFEICDAKKLPFEDKSFDYVVCMTTFANFGNDKFQILKEMKRVCKSSLIVSVFSEEAMPVRKKVYDKFGLNYEEKNGIVKFLDLKKDNVSEQFSETNLREIFRQVQLNIKQIKKVNMAYIVELTK